MFRCIVIVLMCLPYCMCVYFSQTVWKIYQLEINQLLQGGVQNWCILSTESISLMLELPFHAHFKNNGGCSGKQF